MKAMLTRRLCAVVLALFGAYSVAASGAFPTKPVRIVNPAVPTGALEITTRLVALKMRGRRHEVIDGSTRLPGFPPRRPQALAAVAMDRPSRGERLRIDELPSKARSETPTSSIS